MEYKIYCDESRHDGAHSHRYMAIGGLWVPVDDEPELLNAFREIRGKRLFNRELKWSKMKSPGVYREMLDLFFDAPSTAFRAIVVDQSRVDVARYHQGDNELGFYKFYYEMLEKWILPRNEYSVLLDHKQNRDPNRYSTMRRYLHNRGAKVGARIADLDTIDSAQEPMVQICDVLTGAIAASCCDDLRPGSPKEAVAAYIAKRAGFLSLKNSSLSPKFSKFNVFRIELR